MSGRTFILELEERLDLLLEQTVHRNPFWIALREGATAQPVTLYWGMCLENFHILAREPLFDGPVLAFPGNALVRDLLNKFYAEELGHDRLLLKALEAVGLRAADVRASIPLATTSALIDALSFWSRFDPLFFVTTLGVLEGREVAVDAFVVACKERGLPRAFVEPIEAHARINAVGRHGELTRRIFDNVDVVSDRDHERVMHLLPLFVAIYDGFYRGIWERYRELPATSIGRSKFLRRVPAELR